MAVLEGAGIDIVVDAVEDLVPLLFVLGDGNGLVVGHLAGSHHGFLTVDPGGDEGRETAAHLLALAAHGAEALDGALGGPGNLAGDVPAAETLVLGAVALPDFVDDVLVGFHLVAHVAGVPVLAAVVQAQHEFHVILLCQAAEHVDQVHRRHVAALPQQVGRRIGDELAVAATDVDNRVDADGLHVPEVPVPLPFAPVLVRDVVGNLIQEGARDGQAGTLRDNEVTVYGRVGRNAVRICF